MNIFVTDEDPKIAAQHLDDKRLNKMIIETTQMLSHILGGPYKLTHTNHPCVVWLKSENRHASWLIKYFMGLVDEYDHRFNKKHLSTCKLYDYLESNMDAAIKFSILYNFKPLQSIQFCNCSFFKHDTDIIDAYRETLSIKWKEDKRPPRWTNRNIPSWDLTNKSESDIIKGNEGKEESNEDNKG